MIDLNLERVKVDIYFNLLFSLYIEENTYINIFFNKNIFEYKILVNI